MSALARLPWAPVAVARSPGPYTHVDMRPPAGMVAAAERGLRLRAQLRRGGTAASSRMALLIIEEGELSSVDVRSLQRFFARAAPIAEALRGTPAWLEAGKAMSSHRVEWDLHGGDTGAAWVRRVVRQLDAADAEASRLAALKRSAMPWAPKAAAMTPPSGERARAVYWRGWLDSLQRPAERRLLTAWRSALRHAAKRYSDRAGKVLGGKKAGPVRLVRNVVSASDMAAILDTPTELRELSRDIPEETIRRALRLAFLRASAQMGQDFEWSPQIDPTTEVIADMVTLVEQSTKDAIAKLVRDQVAAGTQVNELQAAIQQSAQFTPTRALRVARTETTKLLSKGTRLAYEEAAAQRIDVKVQWLSARDESVRPDHVALDGEEVRPGEPFVVPAGSEASEQKYIGAVGAGPGEFSEAGMVVNCRCTTIPVVQ